MAYERLLSALTSAARSTSPHKILSHFVMPVPICTIYISADSPKKNVKMGLSYINFFVLPELQASQKFRVHMYVDRPQNKVGNSIPMEIVCAPSLYSFKKRLNFFNFL